MSDPPPDSFGWLLRTLRQARRLTIEELAERSGVGSNTISELERGKTRAPQRGTARLLAAALELTADERVAYDAAARRDAPVGGRAPGGRHAPGAAAARRPEPAGPAAREPAGAGLATWTLPYSIRSFTGREAELRRLTGAVTGDRAGIAVVEGMPGVGKTSLAVTAAHTAARHFPDGQLFIDLQGYTHGLRPLSSAEALRALLHCLGMPNEVIPRNLAERSAAYRSRLAGTRTLIVLDNAANAAQVRPLLPGDGGCPVIITSRTSLRGLDDADVVGLPTMPQDAAIALFAAVAGPERIPADAPELAQIVRLCECLPLAVRIIAAWMSRRTALSIGDVLAELRDEHDRLAHLQDGERGISAVFELSYRRLPPAQQQLFRRLGLVPGPDFDVCAAASLVPGDDAWQLLDSLLDHNLLIQQTAGRYRFHELVRAYARTLPAGEHTAAGHLLDFYLWSAQAADLRFDRRIPSVRHAVAVSKPKMAPRLDTTERARAWAASELANLAAAAHHAAGAGRPDGTIALASALAQYMRAYGPWPQALALHRAGHAAARDTRTLPGQAAALVHIGVTLRQLGRLAQAVTTLTRAVGSYRRLDDHRGLAAALTEFGVIQRLSGASLDGEASLIEALRLYRELGDRHGEAGVRAELGGLQRQLGKFGDAEENLRAAISLFRELRMRYGEAATLAYLGSVQLTTGALDAAEQSLTEGLAIYRERGEPIGQANNLLVLGAVYREAQQLDQAGTVIAEALEIYRAVGYRHGQAGALTFLGTVQQSRGKYGDAAESFSQALELFRAVDDPGGTAETLNHYGALARALGTPGNALARHTQALELARKISSPKDEADALAGLAATCMLSGQAGQARTYYQQAHELYVGMGCDVDAVRVQHAMNRLPADPAG